MPKNYANIEEHIRYLIRNNASKNDLQNYINTFLKEELQELRTLARVFYNFKPKPKVHVDASRGFLAYDDDLLNHPDILFKALEEYKKVHKINEYIRKESPCFFSTQHPCKAIKIPSLVFIAGSTDDSLKDYIESIKKCLKDEKYKPLFATDRIEMALDVFCERICSKIIASRFCVCYLTAPIIDGKEMPNPNMYWEYGFMKSLDKEVIPIIEEGQKLYFNIQGLGTLIYSDKQDLREKLLNKIREFESLEAF